MKRQSYTKKTYSSCLYTTENFQKCFKFQKRIYPRSSKGLRGWPRLKKISPLVEYTMAQVLECLNQ